MKKSISIFCFLLLLSCVDRIDFNTGLDSYPVVVEGFISDQPGPYVVRISRSFDIQSKTTTRTNISAKKITIYDDSGYEEILSETEQGVYVTRKDGIKGVIGRSYKIRVELLDGKIYESNPDKLLGSGKVDSVYFQYEAKALQNFTTDYGFNVFFDANIGSNSNSDFLWKFYGTYEVETNPEAHTEPCGESRCLKPRPCSGWAFTSNGLEQVGPCTCCTCWVSFSNDIPIVSGNEFVQGGIYKQVSAYRVPITEWIFSHKVYVRIEQMSLSPAALLFWKSIKAQKEASGSLFQPISGKIPSNYNQLAGAETKLEGIFFATSITKRGTFITRDDVPNQQVIPSIQVPYNESCLSFPISTNQIPDFWR